MGVVKCQMGTFKVVGKCDTVISYFNVAFAIPKNDRE